MRPEPDKVERVAVIGAGTIGASWATQFLSSGLDVAVHDPGPNSETRIRGFIENAWPTLERLGLDDRALADLRARGIIGTKPIAPEDQPTP